MKLKLHPIRRKTPGISGDRRFLGTVFAAVALLLLAPLPAYATDFRVFGFGARAVAMGGAMTGHVDDFTATFYNPAGLVKRPGKEFAIGLQYTGFDLSASNPSPVPEGSVRDSSAQQIPDTFGAYGGMRFRIPFADSWKDRFAFGISFYSSFPSLIEMELVPGFVPQYVLLNGQTKFTVTEPGLAARVIDGLDIGIGCVFFADVGGNLEIPTGVRGADGVDDAHTTIDQEIQPVIRATAGAQVDGSALSEDLSGFSVGLTWRDAFSIPLQIPITVLLGPIPLDIDLTSQLLYTPMQAVLGLAYRTEDLTLAIDASWNRWSAYVPPTLELDLNLTIPVVPIDLKDSFNPHAGTKDTWTPRAGAEWRTYNGENMDVWLRGGYAFEPTPFPEQTGITNYLDDDRHLLSAGVGVSLRALPFLGDLGATVDFDLGFQYNLIASRIHHKEKVNPLFEIDDNDLGYPPVENEDGMPIADPGYPSIEGDASVFAVLFTMKTTFGGENR